MTGKQKWALSRIIISAILYLFTLFVYTSDTSEFVFLILSYLIVGGDVLIRAFTNIIHGHVFDENFLMSIATIGAFFVSDYREAVAVMLFYQIGELFQSYAVHRSRKSIAKLMDIRPDYANIEEDDELIEVDADEIRIGQIIVVKPGDRIPIDGVIVEGNSSLDTSALTGESMPRDVGKDSEVLSGCINLTGMLKIRTTKKFEDSTVSKILDLVENSITKKAKTENFITKFARCYTPIVVACAAIIALSLPFILGIDWTDSINRALIFLVISCPCALVISIPLSFFGGIGGASRSGILFKGGNYLEALSKLDTVVFDKTGTLTEGKFSVTDVITVSQLTKEDVLEWAAIAETYSTHPIAVCIRNACKTPINLSTLRTVNEYSGFGVHAVIQGFDVYVGCIKLMQRENIKCPVHDVNGTSVYVAINNQYAGCIVISDVLKENAANAISRLKTLGISHVSMLTGDTQTAAKYTADTLGLTEFHAELMPIDKVSAVEKMIETKNPEKVLAFVGDGINDAPVLSRADVGIAMGCLGSDAAIEAADVVIMDDDLSKLADAVLISRKTMRIVKQNIVFALECKLIVMILGAFGYANLWAAVFADVGVAVIAILNASRMLRKIKR